MCVHVCLCMRVCECVYRCVINYFSFVRDIYWEGDCLCYARVIDHVLCDN